jgi:hypothetical protein
VRVALAVATIALVALAAPARAAPTLGGCPLFPPDSIWNARVDTLPVHPQSAAWVATIGTASRCTRTSAPVYEGAPNGIPYVVVPPGHRQGDCPFDYDDESDPGPYPIPRIRRSRAAPRRRRPPRADRRARRLQALRALRRVPQRRRSWRAGSGAIFDLNGHALRPATWTSADAAGLPILPGLVRYDEAAAGAIAHALRFTAPQTRASYVWPARHEASSLTGAQYPPMGQRFRLKADVDLMRFPASVRRSCRRSRPTG